MIVPRSCNSKELHSSESESTTDSLSDPMGDVIDIILNIFLVFSKRGDFGGEGGGDFVDEDDI